MKSETIIDIILCILVLPGMMFFLPVWEWLAWDAAAVVIYLVWLYAVYFLCRKVLAPLFLKGAGGILTVLGALFLIASATFLMSLHCTLEGQIPAMWMLLLVVLATSLPVGVLATQYRAQLQDNSADMAVAEALSALRRRASDALGDATVSLKSNYKDVSVPLALIRYVESRNNYVCVHLDDMDDVVSKMPMKDFLAALPEGKFTRIHRSYVVPVWRVESRSATEVVLSGVEEKLPVSRSYTNGK